MLLNYIMFSENRDRRDLDVLGNNEPKHHPRKQGMQSKFYVFTKFPENDTIEPEFQESLKLICEEFQYSHEYCPTTGKLHFQGQMILRNRMRITQIIKHKHLNMHLSMQRGTQAQNDAYIIKNTDNHIIWKKADTDLPNEIRNDLKLLSHKEIISLYHTLCDRMYHNDKESKDSFYNTLNLLVTYIEDVPEFTAEQQVRYYAQSKCVDWIISLRNKQKNTTIIEKYLK